MIEKPKEQPPITSEREDSVSTSESFQFHGANLVEFSHTEALEGESFENASTALDEVVALQKFRAGLRGKNFGSVYDIFETVTNIHKSPLSKKEKAEQVEASVDMLTQKVSRFSPRVADFYLALLAQIGGGSYRVKFETTKKKMAELQETGDLQVLLSPEVGWDMKLNRIETRLAGFLSGARALDKREGKSMDDDVRTGLSGAERKEKLQNAPTTPPERNNESKPGMDEMERLKEGERSPALWTIHPAYGGYFKEQSFSSWNSTRNVWVQNTYEYSNVEFVPLCEKEVPSENLVNFSMNARVVAGRWVNLPIPYTHGVHALETNGAPYSIQQDQNGDIVVLVRGEGKVRLQVHLAPKPNKEYGPTDIKKIKTPEMPAQFSSETMDALVAIQKKYKGNVARARALAAYVKSTVEYSNESKYNEIYDNHERGYFAAIDEHKKADCDVANTYWSALCAQLAIPTRHCVGHSVKGQDEMGSSSINSGTGHGWGEVWDEKNRKWERVDATPPGDSNLEEEPQEQNRNSSPVPGDYGGEEAVRPSDKQIEKLKQKLAERKEKLSYTPRERALAEASGVELKEARKIVKEIIEADNVRLPSGEKVVDVLGRLFHAIIQERNNITPEYNGPVRKSEGGEAITHLIPHVLGMKAGEVDPASRERSSQEQKIKKVFGGLDVRMVGDKSGSMSRTTDDNSDVQRESLWAMQRRSMYSSFSSLYRFDDNIKQAHLPDQNSCSVRTGSISFRGSRPEDIDTDKPFSGVFSDVDRVRMWKSLTSASGGNGDAAALYYVLQEIKAELEVNKKQRKEDKRLRLVIVFSDGGYVGEDAVLMQQLSKELFELGVIVVGVGLTESAANVPVVMNTEYSRGDIVRNLSDLPALVAKHIVTEAIKLFPDQTSERARTTIEEVLQKFKKLSS